MAGSRRARSCSMVMLLLANLSAEEAERMPSLTLPPPPLSTKFSEPGGASTSTSGSKYSLSKKVEDEEEDEEEEELNEDKSMLGNAVVADSDMFLLEPVRLPVAVAISRLAAMA